MTLTLRKFRSTAGEAARLIEVLQDLATRMIQERRAEAVVLCQNSDSQECVVWIETGGEPGRGPQASPLELPGDVPHTSGAPEPLEFLDGFYRFPAPPCRVWSIEVRTPVSGPLPTTRSLLRLARQAAADPAVAGVAVYRSLRDPALLVAFVALPAGRPPARFLAGADPPLGDGTAVADAAVWIPLSVKWTRGRLTSSRGPLVSPTGYPATAFWARWGPGPAEPAPGAAAAGGGAVPAGLASADPRPRD